MLTIRMQRTGRKGLANYRIVVQDSRFSPTSGRVVCQLGHYNPHTKDLELDKQQTEKYLQQGAQPSTRVVHLLKSQKVEMPDWVDQGNLDKQSKTRNPEKLRKNQPKEEQSKPEEAEASAEPAKEEAPAAEEKSEKPEQEADSADSKQDSEQSDK